MRTCIGILKTMAQVLPFFACYLFFPLQVFAITAGGIYTWSPLFLGYVIINVADYLTRPKPTRHSDIERQNLSKAVLFRYVTYPYAALLAAAVLWTTYQVAYRTWTIVELIGITLSTALLSGAIGITVAHELVHRDTKLERFLGDAILLFSCYMHFTIEHVAGHHKKVATPDDNATARFGESIYTFLRRSIIGGYINAIHLERHRLTKRGLSAFSWRNRMLWYTVLPLTLIVATGCLWGMSAALFFSCQALCGMLYLEVINYVEHYGLERRLLPSGRYERVNEWHSWNSDHAISNFFLLKLPTHSDHHVNAHKRYHLLETPEECPQLPFGYPTMVPLAFFPGIWCYIMDPLVAQARQRQKARECKSAPSQASAMTA